MRDGNNNTVAYYGYDAWGKLLYIEDEDGDVSSNAAHIANLNPFRYRGYMYATETGFYYLTTRYYDPSVGRFINADGLISTGIGLDGCNMFAYCGNNPVNMEDPSGCSTIQSLQAEIDSLNYMIHYMKIDAATSKAPRCNGKNIHTLIRKREKLENELETLKEEEASEKDIIAVAITI